MISAIYKIKQQAECFRKYHTEIRKKKLMTWNLFIDDERFPPDDNREWVIARDGSQVLKEFLDRGMPSYISFDHDLGPNSGTGYDIAKLLVDIDMKTTEEQYRFPQDFDFYVHSQNPIGKQNIEAYLKNYLVQKT